MLWYDARDHIAIADPHEPSDAKEPTDPIENEDPTDPIEANDSADAMLRTELREARDHRDVIRRSLHSKPAAVATNC